ncbi:MAG: UvrB/UvrC motif-containing protein, partial [Kiritimatiellia bacterium]|nr:UvrB/UvrC motif-containing protein [Kiritimatiellia bacterium]
MPKGCSPLNDGARPFRSYAMPPVPDKIAAKLRTLPDQPGVYLMRDAGGRIIYVGKAKSLRNRVRSYFRQSSRTRGDPKLRSLIHSIADFEFLVLRSEAEAALTEGRLIKEYRPRFNIDFKDDKRFLLLRMHPGEPVPRLDTCRLRKEDGAEYFGPYPHSASARAALDFAQRRFGLRLCKPRRPGPEDHKHCHADLLRTCSAPCIGKVTPEEYRLRVLEAAAFLRGERPLVLRELREDMLRASEALDFEKAAALRDTHRLLTEALRRRLRMARPADLRAEDARR